MCVVLTMVKARGIPRSCINTSYLAYIYLSPNRGVLLYCWKRPTGSPTFESSFRTLRHEGFPPVAGAKTPLTNSHERVTAETRRVPCVRCKTRIYLRYLVLVAYPIIRLLYGKTYGGHGCTETPNVATMAIALVYGVAFNKQN